MARVFIRQPIQTDWQELLTLHQKNQEYHFPWVFPALTEEGCKTYIRRCQEDDFKGLLICHSESQRIIGVANFSQIFYKTFQNAYLGYYGSIDYAGQRLMHEGLGLAIDYAFYSLGLHRLEANIQPANQRSIALVNRLGFVQEGFSRRYLYINGAWRDHQRWALTLEDWVKPDHPCK